MHIDIGQPEHDELEITTLGAGSSNGESIVIHLLDDKWIIVDSCKIGDEVLPLSYLESIEVPYEKVTKVICTHWHFDHVRGMPEILSVCKNAEFCIAPVSDFNGYLNIVLKEAGYDPMGATVWNILNNCLDVLEATGKREIRLLTHNERVFRPCEGVEMFVVGPSSEMIKRFHAALIKIDVHKPDKKDITYLEENLCSMAFSVHFKGQKVLLGGDMETGRSKTEKYNYHICDVNCPQHDSCGWCEAIGNDRIFSDEKPYHLVNLPHHSSASAYCPKMWKDGFIEGGPIATTTIFNNSESENLPTREMLSLYNDQCKELYITYSDGQPEQTDEEKRVIKELSEEKGIEVLDEYTEKAGVIICRWHSSEEGWRIRHYGEARKVNEEYLMHYHTN